MLRVNYEGREFFAESEDQLRLMGLPDSKISEAKWSLVRRQRDDLIRKTDWTQVGDSQLTAEKKAEFAAYRQALRDIPQTYSDPDTVVWPEKPTV